jgi:hypothetical protein
MHVFLVSIVYSIVFKYSIYTGMASVSIMTMMFYEYNY